jgi:hypothetical protein
MNIITNPDMNIDVGDQTVTIFGWNLEANYSGPGHGDKDAIHSVLSNAA